VVALRLASAGWWEGNPEKVMQAPADLVMGAMQYEAFRADYEKAYIEINKERA
jgi:hypothetical protein